VGGLSFHLSLCTRFDRSGSWIIWLTKNDLQVSTQNYFFCKYYLKECIGYTNGHNCNNVTATRNPSCKFVALEAATKNFVVSFGWPSNFRITL
jgi:hypothetical protein